MQDDKPPQDQDPQDQDPQAPANPTSDAASAEGSDAAGAPSDAPQGDPIGPEPDAVNPLDPDGHASDDSPDDIEVDDAKDDDPDLLNFGARVNKVPFHFSETHPPPNVARPETCAGEAAKIVPLIDTSRILIVAGPLRAIEVATEAVKLITQQPVLFTQDEDQFDCHFPKSALDALESDTSIPPGAVCLVALDDPPNSREMTSPDMVRLAKAAAERDVRFVVSCDRDSGFMRRKLADMGQGIVLHRFDWLQVYLEERGTELGFGETVIEQAIDRVRVHLRRGIVDPGDVARVLRDWQFDGVGADFAAEADRLIAPLSEDRDSPFLALTGTPPLGQLHFTLIALLSLAIDDAEGPRIETIHKLGRALLAGVSVPLTIPQAQETTQASTGEDSKTVTAAAFVDTPAQQVWDQSFDAMLRSCQIDVGRMTARSEFNEQEDSIVLQLRKTVQTLYPEQVRSLSPLALQSLGDQILALYPTCSDSRDDHGSMIRSVGWMLKVLHDFAPAHFRFERLWSDTLQVIETIEKKNPTASIGAQVYRAFPATQLLSLFWQDGQSVGKEQDILDTAIAVVARNLHGHESYDPCKPSIMALLYLARNKGYATQDVTFRLLSQIGRGTEFYVYLESRLKLEGKGKSTDKDRVITLFRDSIRYIMRQDADIRARVVLGHVQKRQEVGANHYYFELLVARLCYDAIALDFRDRDQDATLGQIVFDGKDADADALIDALWSVRMGLIQFTTDSANWASYLHNAGRILAHGYREFEPDNPLRPSQDQVRHVLSKAFMLHMDDQLKQTRTDIRDFWNEKPIEAHHDALVAILEYRKPDDVAQRLFSGPNLVRAIAVAHWPFLGVARFGDDFDKTATLHNTRAFLKRLRNRLSPDQLQELAVNWRTTKAVVNLSRKISNDHIADPKRRAVFKRWADDQMNFLKFVIDNLQDTAVAKIEAEEE